MVIKLVVTKGFKKDVCKFKDKHLLERIEKHIKKIVKNPEVGKPLRGQLHGERSIYLRPFRLIYAFEEDKLFLLRFKHRDKAYD